MAQFLHAHRAHLTVKSSSNSGGSKSGSDGNTAADAELRKFELLRAAAKGGLARAMNEVGVAYMEGSGIDPNPTAAQMWLRRAAKLGEPDALCVLLSSALVV